MKKVRKLKMSSGQTMIEMVVATGMVSLVLVAIVSGIALSIRNSRFSKNKALATRYAQEAVEKFRNYRDEVGWEPFVNEVLGGSANQVYCLPTMPASASEVATFSGACENERITTSSGTTEFLRQAQVAVSTQNNPNDTADVLVTISWTEGSKTHQVHIDSRLHSWEL